MVPQMLLSSLISNEIQKLVSLAQRSCVKNPRIYQTEII